MSYSGEVGAPSMYRRIVRYKVDLPWPLARRDFVSYVVGLSIPDSSCTMLMERAV